MEDKLAPDLGAPEEPVAPCRRPGARAAPVAVVVVVIKTEVGQPKSAPRSPAERTLMMLPNWANNNDDLLAFGASARAHCLASAQLISLQWRAKEFGWRAGRISGARGKTSECRRYPESPARCSAARPEGGRAEPSRVESISR